MRGARFTHTHKLAANCVAALTGGVGRGRGLDSLEQGEGDKYCCIQVCPCRSRCIHYTASRAFPEHTKNHLYSVGSSPQYSAAADHSWLLCRPLSSCISRGVGRGRGPGTGGRGQLLQHSPRRYDGFASCESANPAVFTTEPAEGSAEGVAREPGEGDSVPDVLQPRGE
jgi:hypothetical protein